MIEDDIRKAWSKFSSPLYHEGDDSGFWPRLGPPTIRVPRPLSVPAMPISQDDEIADHRARSPITFSYVALRGPEWFGYRYAFFGECEGVKVQVDGPPWPPEQNETKA